MFTQRIRAAFDLRIINNNLISMENSLVKTDFFSSLELIVSKWRQVEETMVNTR